MSNFFNPVATTNDVTIEIDSSVLLSSLFSFSDLDNNEFFQVRLRDNDADLTSAQFLLNGTAQPGNTWFTVGADDLDRVRLESGLVADSQTFSIQVRDYDAATNTYRWSDVAVGTVTTENKDDNPPTLTADPGEVLEQETRQISDLLTYTDPEGNPAVVYWFVDRASNANGGRFFFNGSFKQSGKWFSVPADRLDEVVYHGAKFGHAENIGARVSDGKNSSDVVNFAMRTTPNEYRPEVTVLDRNAPTSSIVNIRSLINIVDEDGNTMKKFSVNDTGIGADSGRLTYNDVPLAAGQTHVFNWSEIGRVKYEFAQQFDTESLVVRVNDGRYWSSADRGVMRAVTTPVITLDTELVFDSLDQHLVTDLFTKQDIGPDYTQIQVVDETGVNGPASANFIYGSQRLQTETVYTIPAADFDQLTINGAANWNGRQQDNLLFRVNNGTEWGDWTRFNVTTDPVGARSLDRNLAWFVLMDQPKTVITYSFAESVPDYYAPDAPERQDFTPLASSQRQLTREIMDMFEDVADLEFVEVPHTASSSESTIVIGAANLQDAQGWSYRPQGDGKGNIFGDFWLHVEGPTNPNDPDNSLGGYGLATIMHELGHSLAFDHPHEGTILPPIVDTNFYTVMSYNDSNGFYRARPDGSPENPSNPALWDIVEIQRIYGANMEHDLDNTHHFYTEDHIWSLWDAGGIDTLNFQNHFIGETMDLREGYYSSVNGEENSVLMTYGTVIENARGGFANDNITGNESVNRIWGNGGNDILRGMGGNDIIQGNAGDDTYVWSLGDGHDTYNENRGGGRDVIEIHSYYAIDALEDDFSFLRTGRNLLDLRINLTFDQGRGQGSLVVKNMGWGNSRVETLRFFNRGEQVGEDIDLHSVYVQVGDKATKFRQTDQTTPFGHIATFA